MKDKIAVCVVGDFKFLYKYFNRFIDELRINGNYQGEVLILTDYFTPTFILLLTAPAGVNIVLNLS